ncbi:MAG: ABC transporter ATP-binding protein [Crenarchaeota archaeon]|nr:ABC transporter ATP-binding protein [Thermoproteota archaeon]
MVTAARAVAPLESLELPRGVALRALSLSVVYRMPRGVARVVDRVDFDLVEGAVTAIVGESGSGKTMLASALLKLVPYPGRVEGRVLYRSELLGRVVDVLSLPKEQLKRIRWREIAMVFQGAQNSFNPTMKIAEHFIDTAEAHGWRDRRAVLERARKLLEMVMLDPDRVLESYPHQLSGGMKQRALIALSLLLDPKVLILDEPTSALDTVSQKVLVDLLKDIHARLRNTMVFITHDLPLILGLAHYAAIMYAFKIVEYGPIEEIVRNPRHPYTAGLLKSVPPLRGDLRRVRTIPGTHPDPINPPRGCRFHPRCPLATEVCRRVEPKLIDVGGRHLVACHRWEEVEVDKLWS